MLSAPFVCDLYNVLRIDVSNAIDPSYGKREIVLLTEDEIHFPASQGGRSYIFPRLLRLSKAKYSQELANYLKLREQLIKTEKNEIKFLSGEKGIIYAPRKVIDFRIDQLAFIEDFE